VNDIFSLPWRVPTPLLIIIIIIKWRSQLPVRHSSACVDMTPLWRSLVRRWTAMARRQPSSHLSPPVAPAVHRWRPTRITVDAAAGMNSSWMHFATTFYRPTSRTRSLGKCVFWQRCARLFQNLWSSSVREFGEWFKISELFTESAMPDVSGRVEDRRGLQWTTLLVIVN